MMTDKQLLDRLRDSTDPLCNEAGARIVTLLVDNDILLETFINDVDATCMAKLQEQDKQIQKLQEFIRVKMK